MLAVPVPKTIICTQKLSRQDTEEFEEAIQRHYWYELFMDDLPIWGFVGELKQVKDKEQAFIYTHKQLDISYNKDRVSCRLNINSVLSLLQYCSCLPVCDGFILRCSFWYGT